MNRRSQIEPLENRLLYRALGVDVSDHQGDITASEWTQIKNSGRVFAFAKATEGVTFDATTFNANMTRGRAAGVLMGAYHFGRPDNNTATAEADHFVQVIRPYLVAGNLRPVLDIETDAGDVTFMSNWVNAFCNRVLSTTGIRPLIYTGQSFASSNFNSSVTQWPLWIARYPSPTPDPHTASPGSTTPWSTWNFWQYSSTVTVPGMGAGDVNVFNGELPALEAAFKITAPDVTVTHSGSISITDGQTTPVSFGTVTQGNGGPAITFTVRNDGQQALTLSNLSIPAGYNLVEGLATTLLSGQSDQFSLQLSSATVGVKSGIVSFNNNDPDEAPFNFQITGEVLPSDTDPPAVVVSAFAFETSPHKLVIAFNEDVGASLSLADFAITNLDGGPSPTPSFSYQGNVATLDYGGTIVDGNYRLTVLAAGITDASGNPLPSDVTYDFFHFAGDADHDRTVNISDFSRLAANFNKPGTFSQGDFNYSGTVEIGDFSILASRFNTSLPAARGLPASSLAVSSKPTAIFAADRLIETIV